MIFGFADLCVLTLLRQPLFVVLLPDLIVFLQIVFFTASFAFLLITELLIAFVLLFEHLGTVGKIDRAKHGG